MHLWLLLLLLLHTLSEGLVTDRADLLSKTTISRLDDSIARIQRTYGRDVLVLTLPSSVVNGTNARDVAHRYAGSLSGVIFLMSDKGLWLFASKGLSMVFTDAVKRQIWERMIEYCRKGEFDSAVLLGLSEVQDKLATTRTTRTRRGYPPRPSEDSFSAIVPLLIMGGLCFMLCRCMSSACAPHHGTPVYGVPMGSSGSPNAPPGYNPNYNPGYNPGGWGGGSGRGGGLMTSIMGGLGGAFMGNMIYDSLFHRSGFGGGWGHGGMGQGYDQPGMMGDMYNDAYPVRDEMDYMNGVGGDFSGGDFGGGDFGGGDFGGDGGDF